MGFLKRQRFISVMGRRSNVPEGTWVKCPGCTQAVYRAELEQNKFVCNHCSHHLRVSARQRIDWLIDPDTFEERHAEIQSCDPLTFSVEEVSYSYAKRVEQAKEKTGLNEACVTGIGKIEGERTSIGVMDFSFRGGSMGSALGEKFCRGAKDAIENRIPFIMFASSGGARMEEGILSLMQMAKTSDAVAQMNETSTPYISVLTDPTTGGVYASFASLGDVILAEPGAHIGFAGPRLIEGAFGNVSLPDGFQKAEYQFKHGFIDRIVERPDLKPLLARLVRSLSPSAGTADAEPAEESSEDDVDSNGLASES